MAETAWSRMAAAVLFGGGGPFTKYQLREIERARDITAGALGAMQPTPPRHDATDPTVRDILTGRVPFPA